VTLELRRRRLRRCQGPERLRLAHEQPRDIILDREAKSASLANKDVLGLRVHQTTPAFWAYENAQQLWIKAHG